MLKLLPRDTRDTLFILAVIGWIVLMQVPHLPWWTSTIAAGVLVWRAVLTWYQRPLPRWTWRVLLLALILGATWWTHRTLLGRDAGVTLIVTLLALKTLELRARRDAFVVFFLGFFTLLTHFFYSQSLLTAAGILIALLGLLTALVNAHLPVGRPPLWQSARTAGGMALLGAPIMLVLFLLFPRMAPLWGMPNDAMTGRSGLSGEMRVGEVASLALNDDIAFRIRFDGRPPPQQALYFRGPVLSDFDGQRWRALRMPFPARTPAAADLQVSGPPVRYEVTLEPHQRPWLFVLEATPEAPTLEGDQARMLHSLQWVTERPVMERLRYRAESYPDFRHGPLQASLGLQAFVELPPGYNPRTLAWAQTLREQVGKGPDFSRRAVAAVMDHLRTGGYTYTLEPGVYGTHTADEFWFDRKAGFCEHIASSFVILMRALDIPARIVTGYQGGEINTVDGYFTVRQRDAHAWAEVWESGRGWVRVDPTSAVAPGRTGSFDRLLAPENAFTGALRSLNPTLAAQWRNMWEAVNNRWNQWVLNYTQGRQLDLLRQLGFKTPNWQDLVTVLAGLLVLVSLAGAGWQLWERQQHDPWLRLLRQLRQRLQRLGLDTADHMPPRTIAQLVARHFGDTDFSRSVTQWLMRLEALRYAPQSADSLGTLRQAYRQIVWPSQAPD
ncbi:transglutaminase family protein [Hydrogenophaga sp. NFH-34]|uniref:transglutaminase family protein n=1 Tax=Hydrogenophaga sp. NFH-34 TaxID=2744446 RepID=UPI001F19C17D|nr:DUF3488 and transglutaminase-like domain-containing protein [Hydrogenophaga sp. NFH-34]